jgi:hypothetical protein
MFHVPGIGVFKPPYISLADISRLRRIAQCMTFHKQNQNWLISLGVTITLLWATQFAADWFRPHSDIEFAQHSKIERANIIQSEWSGFNRASRLESKHDPVAFIADPTANTLSGRGQRHALVSAVCSDNDQPTGLPGIRAPPLFTPSA